MLKSLIVLLVSTAIRADHASSSLINQQISFNPSVRGQLNPPNAVVFPESRFNQQSLSSPLSYGSQMRSQIPTSPVQPLLPSVQSLGSVQVSQPTSLSFENQRTSQVMQPVSQSFQSQPIMASSQFSQPLSQDLRFSQVLSQQLPQSVQDLRTTQVSQPTSQLLQTSNPVLQSSQQIVPQSIPQLTRSVPQTVSLSQSIPQSLLSISRTVPIPQSIPQSLLSLPRTVPLPQSIPQSLLSVSRSVSQSVSLPQPVLQSIPQSLLSVPRSAPLLSPAQKALQLSRSMPQIALPQQSEAAVYQTSQSLPTNGQLRDTSAFQTPVKSLNFAPTLPQPQPLPVVNTAEVRTPVVSQPISSPVVQTPAVMTHINTPVLRSQTMPYSG